MDVSVTPELDLDTAETLVDCVARFEVMVENSGNKEALHLEGELNLPTINRFNLQEQRHSPIQGSLSRSHHHRSHKISVWCLLKCKPIINKVHNGGQGTEITKQVRVQTRK